MDQAQAQLVSAQATERNAALALQRSQELVKTNAVAQATVDQNLANQGTAAAAVTSAQATLEQANINLAFTEIKAPIDGSIGMANVSVGNFVNQATGTLATIVSQDSIYVLFPATTAQVLDYRQRTAKTPGWRRQGCRPRDPAQRTAIPSRRDRRFHRHSGQPGR